MWKKWLLAGAVTVAGFSLAPERADAQVFGPVIRYGTPAYRPPVRSYRRYAPPRYRYDSRYRSRYRPRPIFPGPAFGAPAYRGPVYRSYRPPVIVSPGGYYVPRRSSGFSLRIGPSYGW